MQVREQLRPQVGMNEDLAGGMALGGIATPDPVGLDGRQQPTERPVDVADQLDLREVGGVDLGRLRIDVDDPGPARRIPQRGAVFDRVVANRDRCQVAAYIAAIVRRPARAAAAESEEALMRGLWVRFRDTYDALRGPYGHSDSEDFLLAMQRL